MAERSAGVCEVCGKQRATNVHHRQPRSHGGTWAVSNLLHLCGSGTTGCHGAVEHRRAQAYALGRLVRTGKEPAHQPVLLRHRVYGEGWYVLHDDGTLAWADRGDALHPRTEPGTT